MPHPNPGDVANPYVYESPDFAGNVIRITVDWNSGTRALIGATVFRDAACVFHQIVLGLGAQTRTVNVPSGTTAVSAAALASRGFNSIDDFLALQITAIP